MGLRGALVLSQPTDLPTLAAERTSFLVEGRVAQMQPHKPHVYPTPTPFAAAAPCSDASTPDLLASGPAFGGPRGDAPLEVSTLGLRLGVRNPTTSPAAPAFARSGWAARTEAMEREDAAASAAAAAAAAATAAGTQGGEGSNTSAMPAASFYKQQGRCVLLLLDSQPTSCPVQHETSTLTCRSAANAPMQSTTRPQAFVPQPWPAWYYRAT